jgi:hypothetical protein
MQKMKNWQRHFDRWMCDTNDNKMWWPSKVYCKFSQLSWTSNYSLTHSAAGKMKSVSRVSLIVYANLHWLMSIDTAIRCFLSKWNWNYPHYNSDFMPTNTNLLALSFGERRKVIELSYFGCVFTKVNFNLLAAPIIQQNRSVTFFLI